jgi:hypothetical protein
MPQKIAVTKPSAGPAGREEMKPCSISQLAGRFGLSRSALLYYDRIFHPLVDFGTLPDPSIINAF